MENKVKGAWQNRKLIVEGIKNTVIRDKFVEKVAKERANVCKSCPRKDDSGEAR